jgi:uncharacterized membrane protein
VALGVAVFLRSFLPEIAGTEKPMDFMLLNAASRSRYYPPEDAWLSGFDVSYYYFGYVIQAMLGKLAAVKTSVAFNLGLAGTAALSATAAFGLGTTWHRCAPGAGPCSGWRGRGGSDFRGCWATWRAPSSSGGRTGSCRTAWSGSSTSPTWTTKKAIRAWCRWCASSTRMKTSFWWWWRATRISPDANSITEFPFFSFILGDLHPHVMSIRMC